MPVRSSCVPHRAPVSDCGPGDSLLATYDYADHGLVKAGTIWTTPGYDNASVQIDLRTSANAGSFELDPEGGCG